MQAALLLARRRALQQPVRYLATTASANPVHVTSYTSSSSSVIPLSNVEAQWERLTNEEQLSVHTQLEEIQKKDWRELSLDEKKAAYYVAFGPHGPRTPTSPPGTGVKVFLATVSLVGAAGLLMLGIRHFAPPPPRTISKEWEEAANERALEAKLNPITGISSEGYSGKGFVTHK